MGQKATSIDVPELSLNACSVKEHCTALRQIGVLPFWWYQATSKLLGNFSLPFEDTHGRWWYQVKPGLCWAVDALAAIPSAEVHLRLRKTFIGYQHVIPNEEAANSHLVINTISDLGSYDHNSINAKRRNAIRKGFRACELHVETNMDTKTLNECRRAWEDLTERTGWKGTVCQTWFNDTWNQLASCPGVSIIVGREKESGRTAGFLITKIIGDTAYVDTIASCSDMLHTNVNDAVMAAFLLNAKHMPGVTKAHYAIKSKVTHLEKFKTSLGFVPHPFPAQLRLRPLAGWLIRHLKKDQYRRMTGDPTWFGQV